MGNGSEPNGTSEKLGDLGGSKVEPIVMVVKKIGMVEAGGHCEKRHESLEHQKRVRGSVKWHQ